MPDAKSFLDAPFKGRMRLSSFCHRRGWNLSSDLLIIEDAEISLSSLWPTVRLRYIREYVATQMRQLQTRRAHVFRGPEELNVRLMRKMLASLSSHHAMTLLRTWAGTPMTASFYRKMHPDISDDCPCGGGCQTMAHLMWECPLLPFRAWETKWRHTWPLLPPLMASAFLCPVGQSDEFYRVWKQVCKRVVFVLTAPAVVPKRAAQKSRRCSRGLD